jgi:hypothetical protein
MESYLGKTRAIWKDIYLWKYYLWSMASKSDNTIKRPHLPDEDHTGLMRASQQTLAPLIEKEVDIYSVADLKVRFR